MDYRSIPTGPLLDRLRDLAASERTATCDFLACLAEADRRDAIVALGYPSAFEFCVRELKLAESTAYQRVRAARLALKRPELLAYIADGSVTLSAVCLMADHIEADPGIAERLRGKRKREVEALAASLGAARPLPDRIRPLPDSRAELRFTAGKRLTDAVERIRAVLWHKFPTARLEDLFTAAVEDFLERHDPACKPRARGIPRAVVQAVWKRDGGACTYWGAAGRCGERKGLEVDHVVPWALGGRSTLENLRLLCRAHNQSEGRRLLGVLPG